MGDVLCPKCGGQIEVQASDVTMYPQCIGECGWSPVVLGSDLGWPDDEDILRADVLASVQCLAHWEPRDRLPTPEEEDTHTAKHGAGAGWMIQMLNGARWNGWRQTSSEGLANTRKQWPSFRFQAYPVTADGRPVGWPEVKHG